MNVSKNTTGMKMLIFIGVVKSFIASGKLRIKGEFPLNELLDKNAQMGGDLNQFFADIAIHTGNAKECGFELEFSDEEFREIMKETELSIQDLPACDIEMIIAHKVMQKKEYGDLSLTLKVSLTDEQNSPSLALSLSCSGQNWKYIPSTLKNQFFGQDRISAIVTKMAVAEAFKAKGIKKPEGIGEVAYKATEQMVERVIKQKSKEEIWELAEAKLKDIFIPKKMIPEFCVTIGIHVNEKLTLSLDFNQKKTKKSK